MRKYDNPELELAHLRRREGRILFWISIVNFVVFSTYLLVF